MTATTPITAVLVGCGGISNAWLTAIATCDDVRVVGLVDLDPAQAERRREQYGLEARIFSDLTEALQTLDPQVVFDCTVPPAHEVVATTALAHGCHVLGEKPLAADLAAAKRVVAAAEAAGRIHAVIQNRRYLPDILRFRDVLQSGTIGAVEGLHADFFLGPHFGGFREEMDHVLLVDMAIHTFDQARLLLGDAVPESVQCIEWNPPGSWFRHGANALCVFTFSGGCTFTYRGSWCAEGCGTSWECDWRATGRDGSALWDGGKSITGERIVERGRPGKWVSAFEPIAVPAERSLEHQGHAGVIREFCDCVHTGGTPQTVCTDNIISLAMVEAAVQSAEADGQRIHIDWS